VRGLVNGHGSGEGVCGGGRWIGLSNETYLGDRRGKEQGGDGADELHNCEWRREKRSPCLFYGVWMRGFVVCWSCCFLLCLAARLAPPSFFGLTQGLTAKRVPISASAGN